MGVGGTFSGISEILDVSYSGGHGVFPGMGTLRIAPQSRNTLFSLVSDLAIFDGLGGSVTIKDCRVSDTSFEFNAQGQVVALTVSDYRWRWKHQYIHGRFNIRPPDLPKSLLFQKSPQELAVLCLQALGVTDYDVGFLPNAARPETVWVHEKAANALDDLCRKLGCVVVPQINGRVEIHLAGVGGPLPAHASATSVAASQNVPIIPEKIRVVGSDTIFQLDALIKPYGLDLDGTVRPIDELSYAPAGGWAKEPLHFPNVKLSTLRVSLNQGGGAALLQQRRNSAPKSIEQQLAQATVWRWYRIGDPPLGIDETALSLPGYGTIQGRVELLPLFERQPETIFAATTISDPSMAIRLAPLDTPGEQFTQPGQAHQLNEGEHQTARPPLVWGFYSPRHRAQPYASNLRHIADSEGAAENTADSILPWWQETGAEVKVPFEIDVRLGLVKFARQVFLYQATGASPGIAAAGLTQPPGSSPTYEIKPAILGLRIGCRVLDSTTNLPVAFSKEINVGGRSGHGTRVVYAPELQQRFWRNSFQAANQNRPTQTLSNDVQAEADYILNGTLQEYTITGTGDNQYGRIMLIPLDGAIAQVTYMAGPGGAFTRAGLNMEPHPPSIKYKEARFYAQFQGNQLAQIQKAAKEAAVGSSYQKTTPTGTVTVSR